MRRAERTIVGWREWVRLPELLPQDTLKAKLDTGARTSAIHAWDIAHFDRDGQRWVRFNLHPRQHDDVHIVQAEALLVEERPVRSSNGESELRPIVHTTLEIDGRRFPIELSLTKRDEMGFRMLLGRTAMARHLLVDPGRSWVLGGDRREPPPAPSSPTGA